MIIQLVVQALKIALIGILAFAVLLGGARFFDYQRDQTVAANIGKTVSITVKENDSIDDVAAKLKKAGLIQNEIYFTARMQLLRKDFVPKKYRLRIGMSTAEIIEAISTGEVKAPKAAKTSEPKVLKLTIIEGWRTEQIADELDKIGYKPGGKEFLKAVRSYPSDRFDFLKDRPDKKSLEGFLFPDTYEITESEAPEDIIQKLLQNFDNKVNQQMRDRAAEMGLSLSEVLTFASLVEREAQVRDEAPVIAEVYLNRFENGWKMDADPTVQYAIGKRDGEWWPRPTEDDLFVESPFNTYQVEGLPPHAICNPGINAIFAVLEPASTGYFYFYANERDYEPGEVRHLFATNYDDHQLNAAYVQGESDQPAFGSDPFGGDAPSTGEDVPIEQSGG